MALNNRIIGGSYPSAFYVSGDQVILIGNQADAWTSVKYNLTGATNPIIFDANDVLTFPK
jgi:hypothetical protein